MDDEEEAGRRASIIILVISGRFEGKGGRLGREGETLGERRERARERNTVTEGETRHRAAEY